MCFPDVHLALGIMFGVNLINSPTGSGDFCLSFIKKLHLNSEYSQRLHEQNLKRNLVVCDQTEVDKFLPPEFLKHAHSPERILEFLKVRPELENSFINKLGETLVKRQKRFTKVYITFPYEHIHTYSRSIEVKRQKDLEALLKTL